MLNLVVPGPAVPAVRMTQASKRLNVQAQRYLVYKDEVTLRGREAMRGAPPMEGQIGIIVEAYVQERKWDASNVLKAIEDGLNGVAYLDDWQIIDAYIRVHDGAHDERVQVTVYEIGESQWITPSHNSASTSPAPSIAYPKGSLARVRPSN